MAIRAPGVTSSDPNRNVGMPLAGALSAMTSFHAQQPPQTGFRNEPRRYTPDVAYAPLPPTQLQPSSREQQSPGVTYNVDVAGLTDEFMCRPRDAPRGRSIFDVRPAEYGGGVSDPNGRPGTNSGNVGGGEVHLE